MNGRAARPGAPGPRLLTIPNILSLLRLPLAVIFILTESAWTRAVIILAAGVSDGIDGWLARKLHQDTGAGQIVDPITDKLFVLVALATLTARGLLAPWIVIALLVRDIYTSFAFFIVKALEWEVRFKARFIGKTVTVLQLAVMIAALLWRPALLPLVVATLIASAVAIFDYTRAILAERRRPG
jgi:CDP-diacylglycerol--glycerol-3-phosphate 3-phosphatidyltransferase/cardiolipin synthase